MATGTATYYVPDDPQVGGMYTLNRIKIVETWNDETNTSDFTITYQGMKTTGSLGSTWKARGGLKFNGSVIIAAGTTSGSVTLDTTGYKDILSATVTGVAHNSDGSLSVVLGREADSTLGCVCMYAYYNSKSHYGNCGSGDITITCHKIDRGMVKIDTTGVGFESYTVHIDNGSGWEQYIPYIDTGTAWVQCGG